MEESRARISRQPQGAVVGLRNPLGGTAGLMLVMLTVIYALNFLDRQIVLILQEPIKAEFALRDWQLGLLTGGSISLFYTAMGLPIARWVDRGGARVRMIVLITILWSLMTAAGGLARNYLQLFAARMGVGLAESGYPPAAHSLISDYYPAQRRPAAMGVFLLGVPVGVMVGFSVGGYVGEHFGWRAALMVVGLPGVVVALIFALLAREPVRGASDSPGIANAEALGFRQAVTTLRRIPAFVHVVMGSSSASFVQLGLAAWLPSFFIRAHDMSLSEVGLKLGVLTGIAGLCGTWLGGWQASRLAGSGMHHMLLVPIAGLVMCIPLYVLALLVHDKMLVLAILFFPMVLANLWAAPSVALAQSLVPVRTRATASAIYMVFLNIIGSALGPIFAGVVSDVFFSITGNEARGLQLSLICVALTMVWSLSHWLLAWRSLGKGVAGQLDPGRTRPAGRGLTD